MTARVRTLQERISRPFMLLLFLAMTSAWLAAVLILRSALIDTLDRRLEYSVSVLASGTLPLTPELLRRASLVTGLDFLLLGPSGQTISSTDSDENFASRRLADDAISRIRSNPAAAFSGETIAGRRLVSKPVAGLAVPEQRHLVASASLDDVRESVRKAALWFALTLLGAGLMFYLVGKRVSTAISRPIGKLGNLAERISSGERNIDQQLDGPAELQRLGSLMSSMAVRIDDYEAEMMRQNRYKTLGEMAARVAHEIRNPLTAIKMQLQLLQESVEPSVRESLQRVLNEATRLELITANTLSPGNDLTIQKKPAVLDDVAAEVIELLEPQLRHQHIRLRFEPGCALSVALDADRAKQALLNLLVNAADELAQGGEVRVGTHCDGNAATICVEDNGRGVAVDKRREILENPTSNKKFGLGLGLVVARQIAEAHRGRLLVMDSELLGGAKFCLEFPCDDAIETE
ncbi:MAG: HAMP domain-containing histidine kinase [Chromatiales bacterium]|nr:HAMP domain-containing histidine kinase [Chromatiales bacterium]MDH3931875.1 HAMP domain-containing histidine kinase [Chromatiales bacterium]